MEVLTRGYTDEEAKKDFLDFMNAGNDVDEDESTEVDAGDSYEEYEDEGGVTGYHTLNRSSSDMYLDELLLSGGNLLSKDEEYELGKRIQNGDMEARNILVEKNLRLVISVCKKYVNRGVPFEDLVQEGNLGLMRAAMSFDPDMGYRFSTYATWWIRQAAQRIIMNFGSTIRIPVHMHEQVSKVGRFVVSRRLDGEEPSEGEIEDFIKDNHMDLHSVNTVRTLMNIQSIDAEIDQDGDSKVTFGEVIPDKKENVEGTAISGECRGIIMNVLRECCNNDREYGVMVDRFGLENGSPMTLEQVGQIYGVTRERIRQIESKVIRKLRLPSRMKIFRDLKEELYK